MAKFTVDLPFEIGQGIWVRDGDDDLKAEVTGYEIREYGIEIEYKIPGEIVARSCDISGDYTPRVDPQQVQDQWLFETKSDLKRYFKEKGW